jgi:hypothetical protein
MYDFSMSPPIAAEYKGGMPSSLPARRTAPLFARIVGETIAFTLLGRFYLAHAIKLASIGMAWLALTLPGTELRLDHAAGDGDRAAR